MTKKYGFTGSRFPSILAVFFTLLLTGWTTADNPKPTQAGVQTNYYDSLKADCAANYDIFFEDFNQSFTEVDGAQNQWAVGGSTWWFPHHNGTAPQVQDSFLILSSHKNESQNTSGKQEAQTLDGFTLPDSGELIIGLLSDRWSAVPAADENYWADSSVGLELYTGGGHYAVVFVYGHMGVFYDPTGDCRHPDAVCRYAAVNGWPDFTATTEPIALKMTWTTTGNSKTFNFYIVTGSSEGVQSRAVIADVNYLGSEGLKIRLNANVTDTDKDPSVDGDTLKVDYICLRTEGWETPPEISLDHTLLNFGAIRSVTASGAQTVMIGNSGGGALNWTAASSSSWLRVSPAAGAGAGEISASVDITGLSEGIYPGTLTITDPNASNSPRTVAVTLKVYGAGQTSEPFGRYATPLDGVTVSGSIAVTGWVLDDVGVESVKIYSGDAYVGDALLVKGARPDIEAAYPDYPDNYRAGWGYMLLTNTLPGGANGNYTFNVFASDVEGNRVLLGSRTVTVDNANAVKPFGAIDNPPQGGSASGAAYRNQGWVLTPLPNKIPENGSTISVYVDSVKLGSPVYNIPRADIAAIFPGYANSGGPAAQFILDTSNLANGIHTIAWTVTDDAGNAEGIGSRYFEVDNTGVRGQGIGVREKLGLEGLLEDSCLDMSPVTVRKGFNRNSEPEEIYPDDNGSIIVEINSQQLVVIALSPNPYPLSPEFHGYQMAGARIHALPVGSTLDTARGVFSWLPGVGFLGEHHLLFLHRTADGALTRRRLIIRINPQPADP